MISARELINAVQSSIIGSFESVITRGPFTTLYWSSEEKDNVTQQQLTVTVGNKTFEVLVREKK